MSIKTVQYSLFEEFGDEKTKIVQDLTIVNYDASDTNFVIDQIWEKFKVYIEKLRNEGCDSIDENWWRFRYGEFLKTYERAKDDEDWHQKNAKYKLWRKLFEKYKTEILPKPFI